MPIRIGLFVALSMALPCFASDRISGSLGMTSDYVVRGITHSDGQAAAQADLHYSAPQGWTAGVWASSINVNRWIGTTAELDAYVDYRLSFDQDWTSKISAVHYSYPWNDPSRYDYNELVGALAFRNSLFFTVAWAFDAPYYAEHDYLYVINNRGVAYELAAALPLRHAFVANLGVGYFQLLGTIEEPKPPSMTEWPKPPLPGGYVYWNAGLGYDWRAWHVDVSYIGANEEASRLYAGGVAGDRFTVTVFWRF